MKKMPWENHANTGFSPTNTFTLSREISARENGVYYYMRHLLVQPFVDQLVFTVYDEGEKHVTDDEAVHVVRTTKHRTLINFHTHREKFLEFKPEFILLTDGDGSASYRHHVLWKIFWTCFIQDGPNETNEWLQRLFPNEWGFWMDARYETERSCRWDSAINNEGGIQR